MRKLTPPEIQEVLTNAAKNGVLPSDWHMVIVYDIDYDVTKLRIWKPVNDELVTMRWKVPANVHYPFDLLNWLHGIVNQFWGVLSNDDDDRWDEYLERRGFNKT